MCIRIVLDTRAHTQTHTAFRNFLQGHSTYISSLHCPASWNLSSMSDSMRPTNGKSSVHKPWTARNSTSGAVNCSLRPLDLLRFAPQSFFLARGHDFAPHDPIAEPS